jgi:NADH dehydrogenase/NADH:ubiquinone oxidoreductase subunit G
LVDELNITIDGVEVKAKPGQMVLQAAMEAGVYIPYLCYYPGTKPFGACRMCVVNVEGRPGAPASCTTPVAPDMVVNTKTPDIVELRRGIMDLLLSEHPHGCLTCHRIELCGPADVCLRHVSVNDRCVTCPKNERCELKDTVRWLDMDM